MSLRKKDVKIGDTNFVVFPIPPFEALKILGDLQRELSPVLGAIAGGEGEKVNTNDIQSILSAISPVLTGDNLTKCAERLLRPDYVAVEINSNVAPLTKDAQNLAFQDPLMIIEVMVELVMFNFKDPIKSFVSRFGSQLTSLSKASK